MIAVEQTKRTNISKKKTKPKTQTIQETNQETEINQPNLDAENTQPNLTNIIPIEEAIKLNDINLILNRRDKKKPITLVVSEDTKIQAYVFCKSIIKTKISGESDETWKCLIRYNDKDYLLNEYFDILSQFDKNEILKYYIKSEILIYIKKNSYYLNDSKRLSNFILKIEKKLIDDDSEVSYDISLINTYNQKKTIKFVSPDIFTSIQKLKSFISKHGNYVLKCSDKVLQDIVELILCDNVNEYRITNRIGFHKELGWLYDEIKKEDIIVSDTSVFDNAKPTLEVKRETKLDFVIPKFLNLSQDNSGLFGLFYCLSCAYYDLIMKRYKSFPFLFVTGRSQAGKTSFVKLLYKIFGFNNIDGLVYPASTKVGLLNSLQELGNIPLWIEEYDGNNRFIPDEIFKSIYNGSAGTKGKLRGTIHYNINSPLIFTGETNFSTESIINRCITLNYNKNDNSSDYDALSSRDHLSNLFFQAIINRDSISEQLYKLISYYQNLFKGIVDNRIAFNCSILFAVIHHFNYADENLFREFITTQKLLVEQEDTLYKFFENILVCLDYKYINPDDILYDGKYIYIYIKAVYEAIKKNIDKTIFKKETIVSYLRNAPYFITFKNHRFNDRVRHCLAINPEHIYPFFREAFINNQGD